MATDAFLSVKVPEGFAILNRSAIAALFVNHQGNFEEGLRVTAYMVGGQQFEFEGDSGRELLSAIGDSSQFIDITKQE